MKIEISDGKLVINIPDLFDELGEEKFLSLMEDAQWHIPAYIELKNTLRTQYATENWSQTLYDIRKAFFLLDKDEYENRWDTDNIQRTMRETVRSILRENAKLNAEMYQLRSAVSDVYGWLQRSIGSERAYEMWTMYLNKKSDIVAHENATEMVKDIPFDEMVDEWTNSMLERFNGSKDENHD